jgi:hypothetical protein
MNKLPITLFNTAQFALEVLKIRPLLCHASKGKYYLCPGCKSGETFQCSRCQRQVPYCHGLSDIFEDFCDNCCREINEF